MYPLHVIVCPVHHTILDGKLRKNNESYFAFSPFIRNGFPRAYAAEFLASEPFVYFVCNWKAKIWYASPARLQFHVEKTYIKKKKRHHQRNGTLHSIQSTPILCVITTWRRYQKFLSVCLRKTEMNKITLVFCGNAPAAAIRKNGMGSKSNWSKPKHWSTLKHTDATNLTPPTKS